jgi:osmoprotectant transport system substrate-binding protein
MGARAGARRRTVRAALAGAVTGSLLLAGCGLGTAGGYVPAGELGDPVQSLEGSLDGASIGVGSKNFSENVILGKMVIILFRAAGAEVADLTNIPGSVAARQAQIEGQIDAMWEYTGTGWIAYLGHDKPIADEQRQYEAVAKEDLETNDLVWLPPAPMNNTYGFAVTQESAEKYGLEKLSDMKKVPKPERTFCIESEFASRSDGLPGMLKTYGIPKGSGVPADNLKTYQTGAIYNATAKGDCVFGEVFTTDGRILALDLKVLEDDKLYFPLYNVALVVRQELMKEHPEIGDLIAPVTEKLTNEVLLELNARVDVEGQEPAQVAYDWLVEEGFVAES